MRVKSFKENLKRTLLTYSLVPVFEVMVVCIVLVLIMGGVGIAGKNQKANREIVSELTQVVARYDGLLSEFVQTPEIVDHMTSLTKRQRLIRKLYTASVETGYEADLYIIDTLGNVCVSTSEDVAGNLGGESSKKWGILTELKNQPEDHVFYVNSVGSDKRIYMGSVVRSDERIEGSVILSLSSREFTELLSGYTQKNLLVDDTGWVFSASGYNFVDAVGRLDSRLAGKSGFFTGQEGSFFLTRTSVAESSLSVYTITDFSDGVSILETVLFTGVLVLVGVFFAARRGAEQFSERSTADIRKINDAFQQVMEGNLDAYLDIRSSTEFENIGKCYNEMLDSLKRQIAANRELAETVAYEQVKRLESQFNSHFLFNTLDNIRFMCKIDADLAEFMTVSLSELLRYNTSSANEMVTVEEDLNYIRTYLEIMKVRFGDRFDYRIETEEAVGELFMPKLLLQPLIENAIKYGFGGREHLNLSLKGFLDDAGLVFICRDDGVGISPELLEKLHHNLSLPENESSHLGLYNVHRRLQLMYGENYGISLESGQGVMVRVLLPAENSSMEERRSKGEAREGGRKPCSRL